MKKHNPNQLLRWVQRV